MKTFRTLTVTAAAALALAACIPASAHNTSSSTDSGAPLVSDTTTSDTGSTADDGIDEADPTTDAPVALHKSDFALKIHKTSEQCFGSAGCDVEFKVVPEYQGIEDLESINADVTYTVTGLSDGTQTQTFSFDGGNYDSTDGEGFGQTSYHGAPLTAKVTRVESY